MHGIDCTMVSKCVCSLCLFSHCLKGELPMPVPYMCRAANWDASLANPREGYPNLRVGRHGTHVAMKASAASGFTLFCQVKFGPNAARHSRCSEDHCLALGSPQSGPWDMDLGASVYLGGDPRMLIEGGGQLPSGNHCMEREGKLPYLFKRSILRF